MSNSQNDGFSAFNFLANSFTNIVRMGYQPTDVNDVHRLIEQLSGSQWRHSTSSTNGATASDDEVSFKSCFSKEEDLASASDLRERQESPLSSCEGEGPKQSYQQQGQSACDVRDERSDKYVAGRCTKRQWGETVQTTRSSSEEEELGETSQTTRSSSEEEELTQQRQSDSDVGDDGEESTATSPEQEQVQSEPDEEEEQQFESAEDEEQHQRKVEDTEDDGVQGQEEPKGLHDQPELHRFCNGDQCFVINDSSKFTPSWSSLSYATNDVKGCPGAKIHYHSCLGIYKCPVDGCSVIANPAQPRYQKVKNRQPDHAKGSGRCPVHNVPLAHKVCKAVWKRTCFPPDESNKNGSTKIEHKGKHDHPRPHEKLSNAARTAFEETVKKNIDATPSQLKVGAQDLKRSGDLHPSLCNLGTIAYERRKVKKKLDDTSQPFQLKDIVTWEAEVGETFLTKKCFDSHNACILIQFPYMKLIAKNNKEYANQTDTLEKWIKDPKHPNMSVTITSTYCELLGKHVPVYMSITYGRTALHYQSHFEGFIKSLDFESFEDFMDGFTGNIR